MPTAAPSRSTTLSRLVDDLRAEILGGSLAAGSPLREEHVSAQHGVSRHTARSAFAQLVGEHLLVSEPYRGVRVTEFDYAQAADLQLLRCALESEAVRTLQQRFGTTRWPDGVLASAYTVLDEIRATDASTSEGRRRIDALHSQLHIAIIESVSSERFLQTYRNLDAEVQLLMLHERRHYTKADVVAEHQTYLDSLATSGADAVRDHMTGSLSLLFPHQFRR